MEQSICTENGGVFFFMGALSVAFLPLKIYTGQFEIQKKSLKILGDTGTLVQICGCHTLQLWVAVAPPPTNTYVLELAVGSWVQFVVCGLFLDCRKGWCRNRRLVEVRAAGIEITARDLSSLQLHDQSATPQNSCGMFVSLQGANFCKGGENFVDQLHMSSSCRDWWSCSFIFAAEL